jgi:hypothetical protein
VECPAVPALKAAARRGLSCEAADGEAVMVGLAATCASIGQWVEHDCFFCFVFFCFFPFFFLFFSSFFFLPFFFFFFL